MPLRPAEATIEAYLGRIERTSIYMLPPDRQICPICQDPYFSDPTFESAVRVNPMNLDSRCWHIFGRSCITQHIRSGDSWSTRCPVCREEWFAPGARHVETLRPDTLTYDFVGDDSDDAWLEDEPVVDVGALVALSTARQEYLERRSSRSVRMNVGSPLPRSLSISPIRIPDAPEAVPIHEAPEVIVPPHGLVDYFAPSRRNAGAGPLILSTRGRLNRCAGFLERMLSQFGQGSQGSETRDEEVERLLVDIEGTLERLWMKLERRSAARDSESQSSWD